MKYYYLEVWGFVSVSIDYGLIIDLLGSVIYVGTFITNSYVLYQLLVHNFYF